jgi:alpha-methylacyl-CoA racemase
MGPLAGLKVVEFVGIGPGPFCGMMLADLGAEVIRLDRPDRAVNRFDVLGRGRRSMTVDLKKPEAVEMALRLLERADALFEGYRPGVMERLGLGPDVVLGRNPRIVYGRMTGWGQDGPMALAAGHDINYISIAGPLGAIGRRGERPVPPLNLVGDFGGGGLMLAFGILAALWERSTSGKGQVIDAAMVDGAAALMAQHWGSYAAGENKTMRGMNRLDTGAHYYNTYETADGEYISVGSIEPQFYALLLEKTGLAGQELPAQTDRSRWPDMEERLIAIFKTKTLEEWRALMEGTDVCFGPVLVGPAAVASHPHNKARGTLIDIGGVLQHAPAPRFSRSVPPTPTPAAAPGADTDAVLSDWGFSQGEIEGLRKAGAV